MIQELLSASTTQNQALSAIKEELGWAITASNLSNLMKRHSLTASWQRPRGIVTPEQVSTMVQVSHSAKETVKRLKDDYGWAPKDFDSYMSRHRLDALWRIKRSRRDPERIQDLINTTGDREEAVRVLKSRLNWDVTPEYLTIYVKRHALIAPWTHPYRNAARVQELLLATKTELEAIDLLSRALAWSTTSRNLRRYIQRHRLSAPWLRVKEHGAITGELIVYVSVILLFWTVFPSQLWGDQLLQAVGRVTFRSTDAQMHREARYSRFEASA